MTTFSEPERNEILSRLIEIDAERYPSDDSVVLGERALAELQEQSYQLLADYADRLPRMLLSRSPHSGEPLKRCFDPFGYDGLWWAPDLLVDLDEPVAPGDFKVLLGAVRLNRERPVEAREMVQPGPAVPFVVPALLELPGMIAVVGQVQMASGDLAYPVGYFSTEDLQPTQLHQPWCRRECWYAKDDGTESWFVSNAVWDFDLEPYVKSGRLYWTDLADPDAPVLDGLGGAACPFAGLDGDRLPQLFAQGERHLGALPTGEPLVPFGE